MSRQVNPVHSIVEAYFWLLVKTCSICRHGALSASESLDTGHGVFRIVASCRNCGGADEHLFRVTAPEPGAIGVVAARPIDPISSPHPINPSSSPSQIIDLAEWLVLYQMMLDGADATPDKLERRWRRIRAAQCLEEALKFFEPGGAAPPESAFFTVRSANALRQQPERFARERLQDLRAKLPASGGPPGASDPQRRLRKARPWWKFW